jgi:alkylation response protein AidB-like acyl-CoA dehydrogenase
MTDTTPEGLGGDELAVVETIRRFAAERLAPAAHEVDESESFVDRHIPDLAALGVMGMNLPERWGGAGLSPLALLACVEALAGACGSTASMVTAHFLATDAILLGGDDAVRARYLPRAAAGETLGAFGLTEPRAGSNPADMRCAAERTAGGYRLSGVKQFISNGGRADFVVVFAKTDPAAGHRGISTFVVDAGTPGFRAGPPEKTMGLKGGHVFELSFDCEVPAGNRLGDEGSGFRTAMQVLDRGRVEVAAMCLGLAQAGLDAALEWAKARIVGDRPLAEYQGIQWMLADMATELRAARLLAEDAARKRGRGERFTQEAAMAKLFTSEAADKVADLALQIHGGYGYTRGLPLERYTRDLRIMRIYEGSSEIQRNIIARELLR